MDMVGRFLGATKGATSQGSARAATPAAAWPPVAPEPMEMAMLEATKPRPRRRRVRSPHPGVKLKRRKLPSGGVSWRAVYKAPEDPERTVYETLDAALTTKEARTACALHGIWNARSTPS